MTIVKPTRMRLIMGNHPQLRSSNSKQLVREVVNRLGILPVNGGVQAVITVAMLPSTMSSELFPLSKLLVTRIKCITPTVVTSKADSPYTLLDLTLTNLHRHKRLACATTMTTGTIMEGSPTEDYSPLSPISMVARPRLHKAVTAPRAHRLTFRPSGTIPNSSHSRSSPSVV
jgi:hypothetical protein